MLPYEVDYHKTQPDNPLFAMLRQLAGLRAIIELADVLANDPAMFHPIIRGSIVSWMLVFSRHKQRPPSKLEKHGNTSLLEQHKTLAFLVKNLYFAKHIDEKQLTPLQFTSVHALIHSIGFNLEIAINMTPDQLWDFIKKAYFSSDYDLFQMSWGGRFDYIAAISSSHVSFESLLLPHNFSGVIQLIPLKQPGLNAALWNSQHSRRSQETLTIDDFFSLLIGRSSRLEYVADVEFNVQLEQMTFYKALHFLSRYIRTTTLLPTNSSDFRPFQSLHLLSREQSIDIMDIIGIISNLFPAYIHNPNRVIMTLRQLGLIDIFPYLLNNNLRTTHKPVIDQAMAEILALLSISHDSIFSLLQFLPIDIEELNSLTFVPALKHQD